MPGSKSGRYTFPGDFVPAAPDRGHTLKALGFHHSVLKEALNKWIPFVVSLSNHERNPYVTVRPELVEGLIQSFLNSFGWTRISVSVKSSRLMI
jgi:hypothetical protein